MRIIARRDEQQDHGEAVARQLARDVGGCVGELLRFRFRNHDAGAIAKPDIGLPHAVSP